MSVHAVIKNALPLVLDDSNSIAIIWCIDDVKNIRTDLSDDECMEVLSYQDRKHDASMGVSWDTLEWCANYLFPPKEEASNDDYLGIPNKAQTMEKRWRDE